MHKSIDKSVSPEFGSFVSLLRSGVGFTYEGLTNGGPPGLCPEL